MFIKIFSKISAIVILLFFANYAHADEPVGTQPIAYASRAVVIESTVEIAEPKEEVKEARKSDIGKVIEKQKHPLGTNCVLFVKSKKKLPNGLTNLRSKIKMINSNDPHVGDVAVTGESIYGHVAIVLEVGKDSLTIEEGNYSHGFRTVRIIPKSLPLGYFRS